MSNSFRDLIVWQKSIDLVTGIYRLSHSFPDFERYGLASQMQRAAVSIAANIAEGQGRNSKPQFITFLSHARGSSFELQTHLVIAHRLGYLSPDQFKAASGNAEEVVRLLTALMRSMGARISE
jgi:four helix bundle protein